MKKIALVMLMTLSLGSLPYAEWEFYEKTNAKGTISGTIKKGHVIEMQSGSIYEVTGLTLQLVLELAPEALVLRDGQQFKLVIDGFDDLLICKQLVAPKSKVAISPKTALATRQTKSTGAKVCTTCRGRGRTACTYCQGQDLTKQTCTYCRGQDLTKQRCTYCGGSGRKQNKACVMCQGTGKKRPCVMCGATGRKKPCVMCTKGVMACSACSGTGKTMPQKQVPVRTPQATSVIKSHIDGDFEGWEGETIFKLDNGQIWQQASYAYIYHYAYHPEVMIINVKGTWKMKVEGVDDMIEVKRLK